jgi:hypothetical protein
MEKVNNTVQLYAQVITFLVIWAIVILVSGTLAPFELWTAVKAIPTAITMYAFAALIFVKHLWRLRVFQGWIIKVPDLQGTWRGKLSSDWINPASNQRLAPIPVILVIRQTFLSISCTMITKESTSYSTTADILYVGNNEELCLTYNYTNRPKALLRDRSAIHDGAAILKLSCKPELTLEGEFWTNRKTRGDISLKFESRQLSERFSSK